MSINAVVASPATNRSLRSCSTFNNRRGRIVSLLAVAALGGAGAGTLAAVHPAAAAGVLEAFSSAITCASTAACFSGSNSASGPGVSGSSVSGYGVAGISGNHYGVYGTVTSGKGAGVVGQVPGSATGTYGGSVSGPGLYGVSTSGNGVSAASKDGLGVYATSETNEAIFAMSTAQNGIGILGRVPSNGIGTWGESVSGTGTYGTSSSGSGVAGFSNSGSGVNAFTYSAQFPAVYGESDGDGYSYGGVFRGQYGGVWGKAPSSGYPLVATDTNNTTVFYVNGVGDIYYTGTMSAIARAAGGANVRAYSTTTTSPTVEDTGTAQLTAGVATVKLDPTFASTIDWAARPYRVFITPDGDTPHGLFVAAKLRTGFTVREAQGGRSTVGFDYRIVADVLGHSGQRMAIADPAVRPHVAAFPAQARMRPAQPLQPPH